MFAIRRLLVAGPVALVASLALVGPASAEPGNGATVVNQTRCFSDDFGTSCYDVHGVSNLTETRSVNTRYFFNGDVETEFTGSGQLAGCSYSAEERRHYQALVMDGVVLHEEGDRFNTVITVKDCDGGTYRCTSGFNQHYANGEIQFSRSEAACEPIR